MGSNPIFSAIYLISATDFSLGARRTREKRRSILRYVTEERSSSNKAVGEKDKQECRGIAQLVEQRSPKPRAVGSNPTAPAIFVGV